MSENEIMKRIILKRKSKNGNQLIAYRDIREVLSEAIKEFPIKTVVSPVGKSSDEFSYELIIAEDKWSRAVWDWHDKWLGKKFDY